MITRFTSAMRVDSALRNLQTTASGLARLQEQAASQKQITRPSDDPAGTSDTLRIHTAQKNNAQYQRNVNDGIGWVSTVDTALASVTDLIGRARDLTVQGANDGASSATAKEAIALELDSLRDGLLRAANTKHLGRNVFAGNSDTPVAFNPDYTHNGSPGTVERRVADGLTVRVDAPGVDVFGEGDDSVFKLLENISADLRAGVNVGPRLTELDDRLQQVLSAHSTAGTRHSTILQAENAIKGRSVDLEIQRAAVEDIDTANIIMELQMQELTYQQALNVTGRTLSTSLMDYIR